MSFTDDGWRRSKRGNQYIRLDDGTTVTAFEKREWGWGWCIADSCGPRYSPETFTTVEEAKAAAIKALEDSVL